MRGPWLLGLLRSWGVPVCSLRHGVTSSLLAPDSTHHTHILLTYSPTHSHVRSLRSSREKWCRCCRVSLKKKKKKIKNPSQCCNLFWADAVFSERAFGVWFDCLNVTLLIGKPQCLVVLGRGSLLGEQLHLYYLPRFDVWLKHLCVQLCWRWSSTQENLVFFFLLRGGVLAQWMHLVEVDILICMLEDYCQYVFSCLLPLLCLQLTFFSKLFLFFLCLTHTTGSGKTRCVYLICLWWPAGEARAELR